MAWLRLHDDILDNPKVQMLPDRAFRMFINLLALTKRTESAQAPDMQTVAFALRMPIGRARDTMQVLLSGGLIVQDGNGFRPKGWNERQFKNDVSTERVKRFRKRGAKRDETVSRNVNETSPEYRVQSTETETETKEKNPKKENARCRSPARQGSLLNGSEAFFLRFYKVFPLHKSRRAAEKAFVSALKRASAEQIIQGAERYRDDPARKLEFTQRPATWLNADGWLDEAQVIAPPAPEDTLDRMLREAKALEAQAKNG